jgi:hypothetical protein
VEPGTISVLLAGSYFYMIYVSYKVLDVLVSCIIANMKIPDVIVQSKLQNYCEAIS